MTAVNYLNKICVYLVRQNKIQNVRFQEYQVHLYNIYITVKRIKNTFAFSEVLQCFQDKSYVRTDSFLV